MTGQYVYISIVTNVVRILDQLILRYTPNPRRDEYPTSFSRTRLLVYGRDRDDGGSSSEPGATVTDTSVGGHWSGQEFCGAQL